MLKKLNSFVLSALMVISLWPSPLRVEAKPLNERSKNYGIISSDIKIGRQDSKFVKSINLPKRFDLREEGGVSSVKDQNPSGTCWAFATMASIESNTKYTTGKEVDLSEANLAIDRLGISGVNNGGNYAMSASYFANWKGPVLEKDHPFPADGLSFAAVNAPAGYHMQNSLMLPSRKDSLDNQYIKEAIIEKGAVAITYYDGDGYLGSDKKSYYYNGGGGTATNHGVVLVGWDDNYPKEKFSNIPPGNGAFIVKNSWGDWFGEAGYFYISYYDISLGKNLISIFEPLEQKDNYDNRYSYGNFNINYSAINTPTDYFIANKHKAVNTEEIGAVSLYTFSTNVPYDVYIDEDFNAANYPNNDASYLINNKKVKSGVFSYGGFNTVKLDKPIKVDSGKSFLVGIKFKDIYTASLPFSNTEGKTNTFNIDGTSMRSNTSAANTLVTYTYNKTANDITAIALDKSSLTMGIGNRTSLKATVTGTSVSNKKVMWTTSNPKVAVVDEDGVVTAKGNGQAIITASTRAGLIKSTASVSVSSPLVVTTSPSKIGAKESIFIAFNDVIKASVDYSKISLKDRNGNLLPLTMSVDYKKLVINPTSKYLGIGKLHIPSNALINSIGKGLNSDIDLDIAINNYNDEDLINISSPAIRKAVADELHKAENAITGADLKQVNELDIENDIIDLKDIWAFDSLYYLTVNAKTSSTGMEELKYLSSLEAVSFNNIKMINLNYLKNNKDLWSIKIDNGGVYSLEGTENLSNLVSLILINNNIRDISIISRFADLEILDLSFNKIADITPIKNCIKLSELNLEHNNIANIDVVRGLTNLTILNFSSNKITDIKAVEALNRIESIKCSSNNISNISAIKTLSDNKSGTADLYISNNFIAPDDSNLTYLKNNKGWTVNCDQKKNTLYELDNYEITSSKLNSKRPITFTFSKGIKSVNSGDVHLGPEFNNEALKYEIKGNKLIIHDEQIRSKRMPYTIKINFNITDENGSEQVIDQYIDMSTIRSQYYSEDVNKNGTIDITDIAQLAKHYNLSAIGETQWNFDEDINLDGIIDIYDLISVASQM